VGYDVHITRARFWPHSERYPIRTSEWLALVADNDDLYFDKDHYGQPTDDPDATYMFDWKPATGDGSWFMCSSGEIRTKNPEDATIRRMIEMAADLDAWVTGDDHAFYSIDQGTVAEREPTPQQIDASTPHFITHGSASGGMNWDHPILQAEWLDVVAAQPDFVIATEVEAYLPSGISRITCPPVATWIGHPNGLQIPFFFDEDLIEVRASDDPTLKRMTELAAVLGAKVLDEYDQAVIRS